MDPSRILLGGLCVTGGCARECETKIAGWSQVARQSALTPFY